MFNSPILDLVILLSFTYFVTSLILSAINESLSGYLRLRQKNLRTGLDFMFLDAEWKPFVKNRLVKSPNIESLMKAKGTVPAYIPAQNFNLAILSFVEPLDYSQGNIKSKVDNNGKDILPNDIMTVLQSLMMQSHPGTTVVPGTETASKLEVFQKKLATFYDDTMDRVTGRYKTKIRKILFVIGFLLAIALNIDTIKISNDALKDQNKLSKTIDNISTEITKIGAKDSLIIKDSASGTLFKTNITKGTTNTDTAKDKTLASALNDTKQLIVYYQKETGYSLGYKDFGEFLNQWQGNFLLKLLGTLITAFALQFSSTYWFELITKLVNIRSVGNKPGEKAPTTKP